MMLHANPELADLIPARLDDQLDAAMTVAEEPYLGFLKYVRATYSADAYAELQSKLLRFDSGEALGRLKFLGFTFYAEKKMAQAVSLGLDRLPPLRILDLGCGPGHFQLIGKYFGHEVVGLDRPDFKTFNELQYFFGLKRYTHVITPTNPFPAVDLKFDLVTSFLTQFDAAMVLDEQRNPIWDKDDWIGFFNELFGKILKPTGYLYTTLDPKERPPEVAALIRGLSSWNSGHHAWLIPHPDNKDAIGVGPSLFYRPS